MEECYAFLVSELTDGYLVNAEDRVLTPGTLRNMSFVIAFVTNELSELSVQRSSTLSALKLSRTET